MIIMKEKKIKFFQHVLVETIIGLFIVFLSLLYSTNYTIIGFIDGFTISSLILFAIGWFMFISNEHLLDIMIYGVAAFGKAIIGKKMNESYIDHVNNKHKVDGMIYWSFWCSALLHLLVFLILYAIYVF